MKKSMLLSLFFCTLSVNVSIAGEDKQLTLLNDISGLQTFEKDRYTRSIKFNFNKVALICVDIEDTSAEPVRFYSASQTGLSNSCCIKLLSNNETIEKGTYTISKNETYRVKPFDIFDNSGNSRVIQSESEDKSAYLDIYCENDSLNPLKSFSDRDINKILKNFIKL